MQLSVENDVSVFREATSLEEGSLENSLGEVNWDSTSPLDPSMLARILSRKCVSRKRSERQGHVAHRASTSSRLKTRSSRDVAGAESRAMSMSFGV